MENVTNYEGCRCGTFEKLQGIVPKKHESLAVLAASLSGFTGIFNYFLYCIKKPSNEATELFDAFVRELLPHAANTQQPTLRPGLNV
jgi:hypothetical protein